MPATNVTVSAASDPSEPRDVAAKAETMVAIAEVTGFVDLGALAFIAHRFEQRLGMLDAAEPARRAEAERLVAADVAALADAYKLLAAVVERGGEA
jgi:hypothetical protein